MPFSDSPAIVLLECDLSTPQLSAFAGGEVALFSRRCPGRESVNEDSAAAVPVSADSGVLMIADGVGGMQAGHTASAVAVESLQLRLQQIVQPESGLRSAILDGFETANERICRMGGAATTLAVIEVQENRIRPYHAGDSMILLCGQRGRLRWQSISHSPVGYAIESGLMNEQDAMSHPDRHFVSNVVGHSEMRIEIGPILEMSTRDTLLLCSDGLSDNLAPDEIVDLIRRGSLEAAVQSLVDLATERMLAPRHLSSHPSKPDDLTIVAFRLRFK